jgi:hypothetical protein
MKVTNQYGVELDFDTAVSLMDDELREEVHALGIDDEQRFLETYEILHRERFGEEWELAKENPVY